MPDRDGMITPPPGLLPPAPKPSAPPEQVPVSPITGGTTQKFPAFRPSGVGAPPFIAPPTTPVTTPPGADASLGEAEQETRFIHRSDALPVPPQWRLTLPGGQTIELSGATVVGRNPSPPHDAPESSVLPLTDPEKSLSKTHALLVPQQDTLQVTDLHSTNGVAFVDSTGSATVLDAGASASVPSGSTLRLGRFTVLVDRP